MELNMWYWIKPLIGILLKTVGQRNCKNTMSSLKFGDFRHKTLTNDIFRKKTTWL